MGIGVLNTHRPLIVCEGTHEQVVLKKLLCANMLCFSQKCLIGITRTRKADRIQSEHLNFDFDYPVCVLRIVDSRSEQFRLSKLYADRFPVVNILTRPEIEMLVIIAEGQADNYTRKHKSCKSPSNYCKTELGMADVKTRAFLERYWDAERIVRSAIEYKRITKLKKNEFCMADLLSG